MKGTIAIFVHQPMCSVQSANGIIKALSPNYTFKIFSRQEVERDFFDDVDVVCFPGGIGDADGDRQPLAIPAREQRRGRHHAVAAHREAHQDGAGDAGGGPHQPQEAQQGSGRVCPGFPGDPKSPGLT